MLTESHKSNPDNTNVEALIIAVLMIKTSTTGFSECPAGNGIRHKVFGNHKGFLEWLATRLGQVVAYARKTLVNLDAKPSKMIMVNS